MGFPAGMLLNTIAFGIPMTATGKDIVTTVTVKPTARVIWAATGQPLPEFSDSFTAEAGKLGQFQVPAIDQPGFIDSTGATVTGWAYQITASWSFGNERPITWSKNLKPLMAQSGIIDLDLVPDGPVSIPVTAPTAAVLGFGGRTGFITLQESDLPSRLSDASLSATYATPGSLDPLQPRGLTVKKLGIVLPTGTAAWENWLVESPNVVFDPITQQWLMVYVGYSTLTGAADAASVGLATSLDGVNWTRTGTPLLQGTGGVGDADRYGTTGPSLYIKDGVYHLFYIGLDSTGYEGGTKRMMLATATSLSGPWTRRGVIIAPSGTGWRSTAIYHRSIVKHTDGKYYMFFNAYGNGAAERIGYATATALLGPWTVDDVNSPLVNVGAAGTWDDEIVGDPSIYRVGDTWYMAYYGYDGIKGQDGVAYTSNSLFPLGWTKHPQNPILKVGATNSYDDMHAHKPNIVQTPGAIYHYYTAVGNGQPTVGKRSIALAIDSPSAVPNDRLNPKPVVDTFSRGGDSATTLGTAPTGQAWTNDVGIWRHLSNFAEVITLGAGSIAIASLDAGYADSKTSMRILTPASVGAALGLIFRMIDASNFIWADIDSTGISLVKKVAGVDIVMVAKVARTIAAGDTITVYAYGTSITVQHNGVTVISTVELFASTAGTRRGFRNYAGGGAQVDDLMVTPF